MGHLITPIDKAVEKQPAAQGTQRQPLQDWPLPLHGPEHKDPGGDTSDFFERNTVDPKWKNIMGYTKDQENKNDEINRTMRKCIFNYIYALYGVF